MGWTSPLIMGLIAVAGDLRSCLPYRTPAASPSSISAFDNPDLYRRHPSTSANGVAGTLPGFAATGSIWRTLRRSKRWPDPGYATSNFIAFIRVGEAAATLRRPQADDLGCLIVGVSIAACPAKPCSRTTTPSPSSATPCSGSVWPSTPTPSTDAAPAALPAAQVWFGAASTRWLPPPWAPPSVLVISAAIHRVRCQPQSIAWAPRRDHLRRTPGQPGRGARQRSSLMFTLHGGGGDHVDHATVPKFARQEKLTRFQGSPSPCLWPVDFQTWRVRTVSPGRSHRSARPGRFINRFQISIGSHHEHAFESLSANQEAMKTCVTTRTATPRSRSTSTRRPATSPACWRSGESQVTEGVGKTGRGGQDALRRQQGVDRPACRYRRPRSCRKRMTATTRAPSKASRSTAVMTVIAPCCWAAQHLARTRAFNGTVNLIFQPAEIMGGAVAR